MIRFRPLGLLAAFIIISCLIPSKPASAQDAQALHWAAWDSALAVADSDPAQRYAFYAYHTLAVPHPEIYLQTDANFSSVIEKMPGSRVAFRGANVRDIELFRRLLLGEQQGPSFEWRMWVPTSDSIYDLSTPNASWLDRRVASAAVLLAAPSPQMSTAEAAMMRYTQFRRGGLADSALFVVIDINGRGYLAKDGELISAVSGRPWDGDAASVVPALVFNERLAVYPLFGRDDRGQSRALTSLLGKLAVPARPALSPADSVRATKLVTAAALPTRAAKHMACIAAMGALGLDNNMIGALWSDMFGQTERRVLGCEEGMIRLIYYRANLLSPNTAILAATGPDTPFDSATAAWERLYLSWCGRLVNPRDTVNQVREAGGYLWAYEMLELTFDDVIRTRAGAGSSQALAMGAALDLRGISNLRVEVDAGDDAKPNQHWVLSDAGRWQFNYGHWTRVRTPDGSGSRFPMIVNSCAAGDNWANLILPNLYTNTDPLTVSQELTRLAVMMPSIAPRIRTSETTSIPFAEFMRRIDDDSVKWLSFPWPSVDGGAMRGEVGSE